LGLYTEGEIISNTGFLGTVTISYVGGTGNDVTLSLVASTVIPGDHNQDGVVDAADYVMWRKLNPGDLAGYNQWQSHFGESQSGSGNSQVPEPAVSVLAAIVAAVAWASRSRLGNR
jgi:hypothetical protein